MSKAEILFLAEEMGAKKTEECWQYLLWRFMLDITLAPKEEIRKGISNYIEHSNWLSKKKD